MAHAEFNNSEREARSAELLGNAERATRSAERAGVGSGERRAGSGDGSTRTSPLPAPSSPLDTLGPLREPGGGRIATERLTALFHRTPAVKEISLSFPANTVTAIIGPSGCGKSTLLRCLNRMHELADGGWVTGKVLLDGVDIYSGLVDPVQVRRRVGMVFQRPTPFPTMSIYENVAAGLRVGKPAPRSTMADQVERALRQAALWDEVKDRLHSSAVALSGGQQQRLCIARAVAPHPEVLLLDEPTASLDPAGTLRIEELCRELKRDYTIVIVTHNMQQAARVSDFTAFLYLGALIEHGPTTQLFTRPRLEQTEAYITGRFG